MVIIAIFSVVIVVFLYSVCFNGLPYAIHLHSRVTSSGECGIDHFLKDEWRCLLSHFVINDFDVYLKN